MNNQFQTEEVEKVTQPIQNTQNSTRINSQLNTPVTTQLNSQLTQEPTQTTQPSSNWLKRLTNKRTSLLKNTFNNLFSPKPQQNLFGSPLIFSVLQTKSTETALQIPEIVYKSIEFINKFIQEEGLYRISGSTTAIIKLRTKFEQKQDFSLENEDVHTVTGVFKAFLRECIFIVN